MFTATSSRAGAKQSVSGPQLLISRSAILHNVGLIRKQLRPGTRICAMIKADAYGHGANFLVDILCHRASAGLTSSLVDQLGVACLDEAVALGDRPLPPILVLRPLEIACIADSRQVIEHAVQRGWILTIGTPAAADDLARIAWRLEKRANVHVMVDTGMTRCGCAPALLAALVGRIKSHASLKLTSLGSHFATADTKDDVMVADQLLLFQQTANRLNGTISTVSRSIANSAAIFFSPKTHLDMVRPGIALYGIDPSCKSDLRARLRPVAKWTAPIVSILDARRGTGVGYGLTWRAPWDTRIGLIPVGYADGYLRAWSNKTTMKIHDKWAPVVGRISMDLTTIDLHDAPEAQIGDEVTIMDDDPFSPASAYALADNAQTIPYEVFTRIGRRVVRMSV